MRKRIIFRLSDTMYEQLDQVVRQGKFRNTSQLVRMALEQFLKTA